MADSPAVGVPAVVSSAPRVAAPRVSLPAAPAVRASPRNPATQLFAQVPAVANPAPVPPPTLANNPSLPLLPPLPPPLVLNPAPAYLTSSPPGVQMVDAFLEDETARFRQLMGGYLQQALRWQNDLREAYSAALPNVTNIGALHITALRLERDFASARCQAYGAIASDQHQRIQQLIAELVRLNPEMYPNGAPHPDGPEGGAGASASAAAGSSSRN